MGSEEVFIMLVVTRAIILERTYLERLRQTNNPGRFKRQTGAVSQGIPVPELAEQGHADNGPHILAAGTGLETYGYVAASSVDQALRDGSAEPRHRILVLVRDNLGKHRSSRCNRR